VAGMPTTYGSGVYRGHVPTEDHAAVARLRAAGAVIVGKTNTPAFGLLGETKNRLGPPTGNPADPERTAGGSSGGSAAAVGAGFVPIATGSDSAGSITAPAGFCGVVGVKPTHGRVPSVPVPDDSLIMLDSGPLASTVADAALMLDAISGHDPRDPVSLREPPTSLTAAPAGAGSLRGLRVAFTPDLGYFAIDDAVRRVTAAAAAGLAEVGAEVDEATPRVEEPFGLYMPLYVADVRRTLGSFFDQHPDDLFDESIHELATYPSGTAEEYVGLVNRLARFRATIADFFERFDVLRMPATAVVAFPHDQPPVRIGGRDVVRGWTSFMPTQATWNLTGHPTGSFPAGRSAEGLPIGLMVVARHRRELDVLRVGRALAERVPLRADAGD
jgi:amidase